MHTQIDDAVALMRMEYAEWPGLKLSFWQAQRLWNLPEEVCAGALRTLTEARVARGAVRDDREPGLVSPRLPSSRRS